MSGVYFVITIPSEKRVTRMSNTSSVYCSSKLTNENAIKNTHILSSKVKSVNKIEYSKSHSVGDLSREEKLKRDVRTKSEEIFTETIHTQASFFDGEPKILMEKILIQILKTLKISNAVWSISEDKMHKQVSFSCASGRPCEETLRMLIEHGIGTQNNSVVSVIPCSLFYQGDESYLSPTKREGEISPEEENLRQREESMWGKITESSRPRLMLAQVVQTVKTNAEMSFDFIVLLFIAAFTAALALVENSLPILVSSMLISPLMGPITAGIFGTAIKDKKLQKIGVCNEILGLLFCMLIGFFFGLVGALIGGTIKNIGSAAWPTEEMISRGELRSLWVGVMVALLSGAAMSIAILGDNTGSLIGVAISVSLLPPAVNAGLLWSLSVVNLLFDKNFTFSKNYNPLWSPTPYVELAILGGFSICLTVVNVVCIFLTGILVLKVKEIAPLRSKSMEQNCWSPLKLVKNYKSLTSEEGGNPSQERTFKETSEGTENIKRKYEMGSILQVRGLNQSLYTWSPSTNFGRGRYPPQDLNSLLRQATLKQPSSLWSVQNYSCAPSRTIGTLNQIWDTNTHMIATAYSEKEDTPNPLEISSTAKKRFIVTPANI